VLIVNFSAALRVLFRELRLLRGLGELDERVIDSTTRVELLKIARRAEEGWPFAIALKVCGKIYYFMKRPKRIRLQECLATLTSSQTLNTETAAKLQHTLQRCGLPFEQLQAQHNVDELLTPFRHEVQARVMYQYGQCCWL
jgi:hypothetical protein